MPNLIGLIPARGGSKGLPNKNIIDLCGAPLIHHSIRAALASRLERVIVSTDDDTIARVSSEGGAEVPFIRPAHLATDTATTLDTIAHAINELALVPEDILCLLQPTSPLRTAEDIDNALAVYDAHEDTPVVSMIESDKPLGWLFTVDDTGRMTPRFPDILVQQRQLAQRLLLPNGALYIARCEDWLVAVGAITEGAIPFMMPPERSIDIDSELDLAIATALLSRQST